MVDLFLGKRQNTETLFPRSYSQFRNFPRKYFIRRICFGFYTLRSDILDAKYETHQKENLENLLLKQFAELLKKKIISSVTLLYYLKKYQSLLKKNISFLPTTMHCFASKNTSELHVH